MDKQRFRLGGVPVLAHSVAALGRSGLVRELVLVARREDISDFQALCGGMNLPVPVKVTEGGAQRQDSVFAGVKACDNRAEYYAIHDGARPFIRQSEIAACIELAATHGAAAVGVRVKDTIKQVDETGQIVGTPPRESLMAIQTPQIFEAALYHKAMDAAHNAGKYYTDDCQLVEQLGVPVYVSPGSYDNIKLTTPEDLALAEQIYRRISNEKGWLPQ
ncbi:MAG: 2-C-methyl-D-erythritol 4-phosphate cytidylyltransferase [Oscillospiraceae bacterium]